MYVPECEMPSCYRFGVLYSKRAGIDPNDLCTGETSVERSNSPACTATGIQYVSTLFQARIDFRQDVVPEASVPPMALLHGSNQFVLLRFD